MQPVDPHKGVSTRSQLLDSLTVYLNNKNRLQPIIGLGSIIECVETGSHKREALYLCEVCVCRLSKADIRSHIMGSLHRYNYIKDFHPHLVSEWKENFDLSKLAWPLMEKAKALEKKEGPGHVKLLEVEGAVYQTIATCSENDAETLINILRDGLPEGHSEATSVQPEHDEPVQSQRIVLFSQNRQRQTENPHKTSAWTHNPPSPNSTTSPPLDYSQTSPEPSGLAENSNSFLDGYTGVKPLIGLLRVVECRGEDGHTYCFLCHCCRIRSNKKDIIDHLTGSSHLMNYLMETRPEVADAMSAGVNGELLQPLAEKVEQEEGRGEIKVINAPESLCVLLTGKSYHWCIKVLCNERTVANFQKGKVAVKGRHVKKISNQDVPRRCELRTDCPGRVRAKKRKGRKVSSTVFKVSLPIRKGAVLLERTSFTVDSPAVSSATDPPASDADLAPSSEPHSDGREPDRDDSRSFTVDHTENASASAASQQDPHGGHAEPAQYTGRGFVTHYQAVDSYIGGSAFYNQPEYASGTQDQRFYGENNRQPGFQDGSSEKFYEAWQNEAPPPASHAQDWTYNPPCRHEEQWYNSASQTIVVEHGQNQMRAEAAQYYSQQHPQNLYHAQDHTSPLTGFMGQKALHGDLASPFDPARINMYPHSTDYYSGSSSVVQESEQRRWQLYTEFTVGQFQTAQQYYPTPPTAYQPIPTTNPSYNIGSTANLDWHYPHPHGAHTHLHFSV